MRWGIALIALVALAQPARADDKDLAAKLFKQGRDALAAGKLDEACARFAQSLDLDPAIGTKLNLADCWEQKGKLADAYRLFDEAASEAAKENKEGRESFARKRADALVKKLVRIELRIAQPGIDGLAVTINGRAIARPKWSAPQMSAPGAIAIEVSAPGRQTFVENVEAVAGEVRIIEVPRLPRAKEPTGGADGTGTAGDGAGAGAGMGAAGAGAGGGRPDTGTGTGRGTGTVPIAEGGRRRSRASAYVVGGIGVALVGTSVALGFAAKSKFDGAECGPEAGLPEGRCTVAGQETTNDARRLADIGTGVAIAGTVAVGVGVYLFFRARNGDRVVVAPAVSDGAVGVVLTVFR